MSSDQEIYESLTAATTDETGSAKKSPCGCGEAMSVNTVSGDLAAELEAALDALGSESGGGDLLRIDDSALDEDLLFSDLEQEPSITLQDIVSLAEQYPGLKITISF
jgi:hypothetical protein